MRGLLMDLTSFRQPHIRLQLRAKLPSCRAAAPLAAQALLTPRFAALAGPSGPVWSTAYLGVAFFSVGRLTAASGRACDEPSSARSIALATSGMDAMPSTDFKEPSRR